MKLLIACVCVSILSVFCSAGNLLSSDHSSLQSILALRSDSFNTKFTQHWPTEQLLYPSLTSSVHSPINAAFMPQNDHANAQLTQPWQDEANWAAHQPSYSSSVSTLSHAPLQHWSNEQLPIASLAHNPSAVSFLPQYNDISAKFIPTWPAEQFHSPTVQYAHAPVTTSLLHQHNDIRLSQYWPTEHSHVVPLVSLIHASPTTVVTQPYAVEKQVPVFVPVAVDHFDHFHTLAKPFPVYTDKKQHDNSWSSPQFQFKRHATQQSGNPNGFFIRKRTHSKN